MQGFNSIHAISWKHYEIEKKNDRNNSNNLHPINPEVSPELKHLLNVKNIIDSLFNITAEQHIST